VASQAAATFAYTNDDGQDVWWIEGAAAHPRPVGVLPSVLVMHHSGGSDSRDYLRSNNRKVSSHYLVGDWPDVDGYRVYKYASERKTATHTQGPAKLGGRGGLNVNDYAISIEIEGPPISYGLMDYSARLAASILRYWRDIGVQLVMLTHDSIQVDKDDPAMDWGQFCALTYGRLIR
jgi:N-acetyl-anhydromuramyl-L-alanine amidase AmpD